MLFFPSLRSLAVAAATIMVLHATPADAAVKSKGKASSTKTSGTKKSSKPEKKTASTRKPEKKSIAKASPKKKTSPKASVAKIPAAHIDITKIAPAESLYRKSEAGAPASRTLSFFGSLASTHHYDSRMLRAGEIASARAYAHSHGSCWGYVKNALLAAGVVDSRPKTGYAKEAASELTSEYGFRRIPCSDPFRAPLGSVLVYGGRGAGHVEFRTKTGFVSDFTALNPSKRPLIGVFVKP